MSEECFCGCGRSVDQESNSLAKRVEGGVGLTESMVFYLPETVQDLRNLGLEEHAKVAEEFGRFTLTSIHSCGATHLGTVKKSLHESFILSSEIQDEIRDGQIHTWLLQTELYANMFGLHPKDQAALMAELVQGKFPDELFELYEVRRRESFEKHHEPDPEFDEILVEMGIEELPGSTVSSDPDLVGPPLSPERAKYSLILEPKGILESIENKAALFDSPDFRDLWSSSYVPDRVVAALRYRGLGSTYFDALPFVAYFLTIELDTYGPESAGLGREANDDPLPRFGKRFKNKMHKPDVRSAVGRPAEGLILDGFVAGAINGLAFSDEPRVLGTGISIEDRFDQWLPLITPTYRKVNPTLNPADPPEGFLFSVCASGSTQAYKTLCDLVDLKSRWGKKASKISYPRYFFAVGWSLFQVFSHPDGVPK